MPRTRLALSFLAAALLLVSLLLPITAEAAATPVFVKQWGQYGSGQGDLNGPSGVAVDANGNVYVADTGNDRIEVFTSNGAYITDWGSPRGSGNGYFYQPEAIAFDGSGNVYVADQVNGLVQVFDNTLSYVTQWSGSGNGLPFQFPAGVATDADGNIYVSDFCRVQKLTSGGAYSLGYGSSCGSANGQFISPIGLAVDGNGNLYVADYGNDRIQVFSSIGAYVTQWAVPSPVFVALDASANVYVSTDGDDHVQIFTNNGTPITQFGSPGAGAGQFNSAAGVAVDAAGCVYVADYLNHRIEKFCPPNQRPSLQGCDDKPCLKVNEGSLVCCTYTATDPEGDPITISASPLPVGATFTYNGNGVGVLCWTPGFCDAGNYTITVTATDGSGSTSVTTVICVENVNRPPVCDAGGPYQGITGVPLALDGRGSSDPDCGDQLTYTWDFGDGPPGGTGPLPSHTYASAGVYTIKLCVTDPGGLTVCCETTVTIDATARFCVACLKFGKVRLNKGRAAYCIGIQPCPGAGFSVSDIVPATVRMEYNGNFISADVRRTLIGDCNLDGIADIQLCFRRADLKGLFAGVPLPSVETVMVTGNLSNGGFFSATVSLSLAARTAGSFSSPNPLLPGTSVNFLVPPGGLLRFKLFDVQGRLVRTLVDETSAEPGDREMIFDGLDDRGRKLQPGVYFYRIDTTEGPETGRVVIVR